MSGIVLSASVRQNLLSLQSTADLLATTQNRLSTGKKVNTALDNPTNFFTAQGLDNRASDINNLLDSIGNGVQILQAANTGLTSLQKLVDTAKSIATQALQSTVGYSTKASFSTTITGATSSNLLGTGAATDATVNGAVRSNNQTLTYTASTGIGTAVTANHQAAFTNTPYTLGSALHTGTGGAVALSTDALNTLTDGAAATLTGPTAGDVLTINGKTITFSASGAAATDGSGNVTIGIDQTVGNLLTAIDSITGATGGNASSINVSGQIQINTGLVSDFTTSNTTGTPLAELGLVTGSVNRGGGATSTPVVTSATKLSGSAIPGGADALASGLTASDYLIVNGKTISFNSGAGTSGTVGNNNLTIDVTTGTINDILTDLALATGGTATVDASGQINLTTTTGADISLGGSNAGTLGKLGLTTIAINGNPGAVTTSINRTSIPAPQIGGATLLSGAPSGTSDSLASAFNVGDTLTVNGQTLTFVASGAADGTHINVTDSITTLLSKIDNLSGNTAGSSGAGFVSASSVLNGVVTLHSGTTTDLSISSSNAAAFAALGFNAPVSISRGTGTSPLTGLVLNIGQTGNGPVTGSSITFGTGANQVQSLNDLNNALAANNLQATLAADGTLTITTSNDAASATIGALTGTATGVGQPFNSGTITTTSTVTDPVAQATRDNLVNQYNNVLNQITTTAQDASFNGVNLLGGDTLKLTFNETGKSTLNISGVNFNAAGLGLAALATGAFKDNQAVNSVVNSLTNASTTLRSESSSLGSNLSIVQIRQDFNKNLINVLQTGSSNLTLADTNEEAANSQALSTRQSIAVSALALANTSQQSVLQLLR